MTKKQRKYFTPEAYQRLSRNPFIDESMLQFIRTRTTPPQHNTGTPVATGTPRRSPAAHPVQQRPAPPIDEKTIQLIAAAIRGLMRE